jgi:hypothetical protein
VGAEPPAGAGRVVDGASHDGMPEAEPAGRVRGPDQPALHQLIERCEGLRARQAGGERGERLPEWVAGHGGALDQGARRCWERLDLGSDGSADRGRNPLLGRSPVVVWRTGLELARAGELLEVQRVSAALPIDQLPLSAILDGSEQLLGLSRRERVELDPQDAVTLRLPQRSSQPRLGLPRSQREQQQRGVRDAAVQQAAEEIDGRGVGPVEIVEREDERPLGGERLEQRVQRPEHVVALVWRGRHRCPEAGRAQERKDATQRREMAVLVERQPIDDE